MLKLEVGPIRTKLIGIYDKYHLNQLLSAEVEGARFSPLYRQKRWDGKIHLLSSITHQFPTGCLPLVINFLVEDGTPYTIDYTLYNKGIPFITPPTVPLKIGPWTLRDYQIEACTAFLNPNSILPYRGIVKCPTGSGKTALAAAIAETLDLSTLFLVYGKSLASQTIEVFETAFSSNPDKIGFVDAKRWNPKQITVASVSTLSSRLSKYDTDALALLKSSKVIIADEVHHASSPKTWLDILKSSSAVIRLGLSGTPLKGNDARDLQLISQMGSVIYDLPVSRLQNSKHISEAELTILESSVPTLNGVDYQTARQIIIIGNEDRNAKIAKHVLLNLVQGKTGLVLAGNSVDLATSIYNKLNHFSNVRLCYGDTDINYTNESFQLLREKKLSFIITTTIADEGIDVPCIDTLYVIGGGKSLVKTIQRIGRGLRIKTDDTFLQVYDVADMGNKFLKAHSNMRLKHYNSERIFRKITTLPL